MTEEAYLFKQTSRERKNIAHSAGKRKCGSRTSFVGLPSDHLTRKEREAMNGDVKMINLKAPMSWEEFTGLKRDLQIEYLKFLQTTFVVTRCMIAKDLFKKSINTFNEYINSVVQYNMVKFKHGYPMENFTIWERFCNGDPEYMKIDFDVPMSISDFAVIDGKIQDMYLEFLTREFNANRGMILNMFQCRSNAFYSRMTGNFKFPRPNNSVRPPKMDEWNKYCAKKKSNPPKVCNMKEENIDMAAKTSDIKKKIKETPKSIATAVEEPKPIDDNICDKAHEGQEQNEFTDQIKVAIESLNQSMDKVLARNAIIHNGSNPTGGTVRFVGTVDEITNGLKAMLDSNKYTMDITFCYMEEK